ncbi:MAG: alanine--tRNA ligase [Dissulfurimicrobium sp.]|uniref:alanine--tRNA ligase n=1 Tax=Dissulfurimicrobium sp. TaxID=2022436 RepID=UPI00404B6EB7
MDKLSSSAIRRLFLDFFARKGHTIVPSSGLVPHNDPTLLFTNAGMVQFKKVFLGEEIRPYSRASTCQKCVRAGGKHNDLENVGYTARHHTFFEMLGNFSFGDYFKKEAISYAWEFLTREIGLPVDRLWVTIFKDDNEAARLWLDVTDISPERVVRLGEKDNFWAMGDTGPCGPCSEILFDQGEGVGCGRDDCRVGCECDRFLEIWNLVFMQYFKDASGKIHPLPKKSIDTGMGIERISAVCQGKLSNFDTDIFAPLLARISELAGKAYGSDAVWDVAMRVIADHARASAFLIADGVMPSNEGRGYVLRRIIRRAVRYGRVIGLDRPFLSEIAGVVAVEMGDIYPELKDAEPLFLQVIGQEEERFSETLEIGLRILMERVEGLRSEKGGLIDGGFAFKLYDTYGFPIDILQDIAREEDLLLDRDGFESAMLEQRKRSKKARREIVAEKFPEIYGQLLASGKGGRFVGYERLSAESDILAMTANGEVFNEVAAGWTGELVVSETPFYAESGGQTGDKGYIEGPFGRAEVIDVTRRGEIILHHVKISDGVLKVRDVVRLQVNEELRNDVARNHTATHLLHAALRKILGSHVKQAGSLVTPQRFRFDFTHFSALSGETLRKIEDLVNQYVRADSAVETQILSFKEALAKGAMALFEEKYGETVRLVEIPGFSMELCGGTHINRTGQIGLFKIAVESSIASGIRRIEGFTGEAAISFVHKLEDELAEAALQLRCSKTEVASRVMRLQGQIKALQKELKAVRIGAALNVGDVRLDAETDGLRVIKGINVVAKEVSAQDPRMLREMADRVRDNLGSGVAALGSKNGDKAFLIVVVTKDLTDHIKAENIIGRMAQIVGGKGGGRPDMAQAGGPDKDKLSEALNAIYDLVENAL